MASLISIGVNGLLSHQSAINTTGNNITNANTPGYSRQRVELATLPEYQSGNGFMGQGGTVTGIDRIVDHFLISQLRTDTSSFHQANSLTTLYSQLDSLLADSSTGLAPALQGFFDSLQQASLDPTSVPIRQVVLRTADTLAQRFNTLYSQLQTQERVINEQLSALTGQANKLAEGIAALNQQISQQASTGAQPNALLDKRDELTRQLSELVGVSVVDQGNGMINISIGRGQPLVVGNQAYSLTTQQSSRDASRSEIVLGSNGSSQEIGQFLTGGQIGGLLQYRSERLDKTFNQLGQMALSIADQFNTVQEQGMDLDGDYGAELTALFGSINSEAAKAGRAARISGSSSELSVTITEAVKLTGGEYRATWNTSAAAWVVTTEPGGELVNPEDHGFELENGQAGDIFLIRPTRGGAGSIKMEMTDPRDLALASPLRISSAAANTGSGTIKMTEIPATTFGDGDHMDALFPMVVAINDENAEFRFEPELNPSPQVAGNLMAGQKNYITIAHDGNGYTLNISSNPSEDDLACFELSGQFKPGDEFTIGINTDSNGTSDNSNALAMLAMRFDKLVGANNGGGQTFAGSYTSLVTDVGARTAELKINQEAADSILAQSQANRDATSGVNLDEEAANLIRFEQGYNASAQVISVARSLFDSLLAAFR